MKRKTRKILAFLSFMLFPITLNFLSPYVSIDGAMQGVVSGSVMVFGLLFVSGLFFGRAWCSYVCPWAAPSEYLRSVNDRKVNRQTLRIIRYSVFAVWFSILVLSFTLAGGIKGFDPLHLTETGISTDEPMKFITYYMILFILFLTTVLVGRRGACHAFCWMSPFMVVGMWVGEKLHLPQFKVRAAKQNCIACKKCNGACPMSIDVQAEVQTGIIASHDCILCGNCVDTCPKSVLKIQIKK